jgi:transposase
VTVSEEERQQLEQAQRRTKRVRVWRRRQAVLLLAAGHEPEAVPGLVGCSRASVYNWATAWQTRGLAGLEDPAPSRGRPRRLDATAEAEVDRLLSEDPPTHGYAATDWTIPLLRTELTKLGQTLSGRTLRRTLRRTLQRLGGRWKRPQYVLGRPDPAYAQKRGR